MKIKLNHSKLDSAESHQKEKVNMDTKLETNEYKTKSPDQKSTNPKVPGCDYLDERQCDDGSCISKVELCPDEQIMNQNTILIMIVVGMAVVIFLIILYCFQQRQRGNNARTTSADQCESGNGDGDNASLYQPPPTYEEVITTNLYPPTPQLPRTNNTSSSDEPPLTPPPNYDVALNILAQSHESVFINKPKKHSPVVRRSISVDILNGQSRDSSAGSANPVLFSNREHR